MTAEFKSELINLLNRHCIDSVLNTPDFIIAAYLQSCLIIYKEIKEANDKWNQGK